MGWKDSVNVHTYLKFLFYKSLSRTWNEPHFEMIWTIVDLKFTVHTMYKSDSTSNICKGRSERRKSLLSLQSSAALFLKYSCDKSVHSKRVATSCHIIAVLHNGLIYICMSYDVLYYKVRKWSTEICLTSTSGKCGHLLSPFSPKIIDQFHPKTTKVITR